MLCVENVKLGSEDVHLGKALGINAIMGGMTLNLSYIAPLAYSLMGSILVSMIFTLPSSPITATGTCWYCPFKSMLTLPSG